MTARGAIQRVDELSSFVRPPSESYQILINFSRAGDVEVDKSRMQQLFAALRDFHGSDTVRLTVANGHGIVHLDLPDLTINYCPILQKRLAGIVGDDGLRVKSA